MKGVLDLSYRYKIPLWGSILIIVTTLMVSGSLMYKTYEELRNDLFTRSSGLAHRLSESLFQPMMEDDVWRVFDIISKPLDASNTKDILLPSIILILDNELKVVVSTNPILIPMGTRIDQLTPEYGILIERIRKPETDDSPIPDVDDKKNYYVTAPIASEGYRIGTLIVVHSKDVLWPRFFHTASHGGLVGLLVLAILLPINWYWGYRLSRPLGLITERMSALGSATTEDLDKVAYPYQDEVGQLFEAYRRMLVEQETKQALEKQIVHSERLAAVGHLAAGVAHEINNPLGGMLTAIDTLKSLGHNSKREFDARTAKTISLIERGLTQIKETVGALLVEARVRSRDLEPQDFEDIRSLVVPQAQKKELLLDWRSSLARSLPLQANQVRQILINLLLNAIHAANQKGLVICSIEEQDGVLHMRVENDGKQLTADQISHLFEPFSPLSESGHGLGLWLTYQIVQQLGGNIVLEQDTEHVIFSVTLPFRKSATA
jgi:two-component system NtrC family sensor kinase